MLLSDVKLVQFWQWQSSGKSQMSYLLSLRHTYKRTCLPTKLVNCASGSPSSNMHDGYFRLVTDLKVEAKNNTTVTGSGSGGNGHNARAETIMRAHFESDLGTIGKGRRTPCRSCAVPGPAKENSSSSRSSSSCCPQSEPTSDARHDDDEEPIMHPSCQSQSHRTGNSQVTDVNFKLNSRCQ